MTANPRELADSPRKIALRSALLALQDRLERAAESSGRAAADIELLPITKFFPASDVEILWGLGCRSFGESREQEASAKVASLSSVTGGDPRATVRWHMVGQLQRNKARAVAAWADSVHSLSSIKVAMALNRAADQAVVDGLRFGPLGVFVQISLDGDTSRGGVDISDSGAVDSLCAYVADSAGLQLRGLMAIPPLGVDPDIAFSGLFSEHQRVLANHPEATQLSAGMSTDLEIAVRHGSTCVRVGTALMGKRPLTSP